MGSLILVAGHYPGTLEKEILTEITIDDKTVGWLGIRKSELLSRPHEVAFLAKEINMFYMMGAAILGLSALTSFLLSRHLMAPIKKLTDGTKSLATRKLRTRIDVQSKDELGQLASDFNEMARTLEEYEQIRQQWISDISHELRTPLSILRGEIEAIQDGVRETSRETLDSLHSEVVRISKIVDDLHKLSLADAKALAFKKEPVNLLQVLEEMLRTFQTKLCQRKIEVRMNLENQQKITLLGDADRLRELFSNLLENTYRYTDSPGTLKIWQEIEGKILTIFFEDSGPGVPEESLGRLFDRLYRVDKSRSRSLGGSGLGLSICKSIVEAHDGEIRAKNGTSGGLRIEIVLPIDQGT